MMPKLKMLMYCQRSQMSTIERKLKVLKDDLRSEKAPMTQPAIDPKRINLRKHQSKNNKPFTNTKFVMQKSFSYANHRER